MPKRTLTVAWPPSPEKESSFHEQMEGSETQMAYRLFLQAIAVLHHSILTFGSALVCGARTLTRLQVFRIALLRPFKMGWRRPADRLACNQPCFQLWVDLLVDEDEAQHGSTHAPLIAALLKKHHLE